MPQSAPAKPDRAQHPALQNLLRPWDDLSPAEQWYCRHDACYMTRSPGKLTREAQGLVAAIMVETVIPYKQAAIPTPIRPSTLASLTEALGIWLAHLLDAAAWGHWAAHSLRRDSFTKLATSRQAFVDCKAALELAGLIVAIKGQGKSGVLPAKSPIFRPTLELLKVAERHGVAALDAEGHFGLRVSEDALSGIDDRPSISGE